jgi:serine/threonine protein kinase
MQAIHASDVVHNDIKCSNILLFSPSSPGGRIVAKISDFGCSVPLAMTKPIRRAAATPIFAAPEAYLSSCVMYPSRDIYAFGLLALHIAMEKTPFVGRFTADALYEFKQNAPLMQEYVHDCLVIPRQCHREVGQLSSRGCRQRYDSSEPRSAYSAIRQSFSKAEGLVIFELSAVPNSCRIYLGASKEGDVS